MRTHIYSSMRTYIYSSMRTHTYRSMRTHIYLQRDGDALVCSANTSERTHAEVVRGHIYNTYIVGAYLQQAGDAVFVCSALCIGPPSRFSFFLGRWVRCKSFSLFQKNLWKVCAPPFLRREAARDSRGCIRQHTSAYVSICDGARDSRGCIRQHTTAYVSIREHTSTYVSIREHT